MHKGLQCLTKKLFLLRNEVSIVLKFSLPCLHCKFPYFSSGFLQKGFTSHCDGFPCFIHGGIPRARSGHSFLYFIVYVKLHILVST